MDFYLKVSNNCVYERVDECAVILNLDSGMYHQLNRVGTEIWEEINTSRLNETELIQKLESRYANSSVKDDVEKFLKELFNKGILVR